MISILSIAFNKSIAEKLNRDLVSLQNGSLRLPPQTAYQGAICAAVKPLNGHVVVNACAGSGKTTTLMHVVNQFPYCRPSASTLHSLCFGALRRALENRGTKNVKVDKFKYDDVCRSLVSFDQLNDEQRSRWMQIFGPSLKLVDLLRCHGYGAFRAMATTDEMDSLVDNYSVDMPDAESGIYPQEIYEFSVKVLEAGSKIESVIDFSDMVYMALLLNAQFPKYDLVLIDESQDLDPAQIEVCRRLSHRGAKLCFVGDRNQAIYGFRGACSEAIDSIVDVFKATELPLSTCWRCPQSVIREAQKIVPHIEWAPNAEEGQVTTLGSWDEMYKNINDSDFVLCRCTAPLVEACFALIRQGRKATVRGRDIGDGLIKTVEKIAKSRVKGDTLLEKINAWGERELAKLQHPKKEAQRQTMQDRIDTLFVLAEGCEDYACMRKKIEKIFSDELSGIICSTVHKAKGLESPNVFIIRPDKMPLPSKQAWQSQQEDNIKYVAITRATQQLFWVEGEGPNSKKKTEKSEPSLPDSNRRKSRAKRTK